MDFADNDEKSTSISVTDVETIRKCVRRELGARDILLRQEIASINSVIGHKRSLLMPGNLSGENNVSDPFVKNIVFQELHKRTARLQQELSYMWQYVSVKEALSRPKENDSLNPYIESELHNIVNEEIDRHDHENLELLQSVRQGLVDQFNDDEQSVKTLSTSNGSPSNLMVNLVYKEIADRDTRLRNEIDKGLGKVRHLLEEKDIRVRRDVGIGLKKLRQSFHSARKDVNDNTGIAAVKSEPASPKPVAVEKAGDDEPDANTGPGMISIRLSAPFSLANTSLSGSTTPIDSLGDDHIRLLVEENSNLIKSQMKQEMDKQVKKLESSMQKELEKYERRLRLEIRQRVDRSAEELRNDITTRESNIRAEMSEHAVAANIEMEERMVMDEGQYEATPNDLSQPLMMVKDEIDVSSSAEPGTTPCNKCSTCRHVIPMDSLAIELDNGEMCTMRIAHHANCGSRNCIFLLECARCGMRYVGQTTRSVRQTFNDYRSMVRVALRGLESDPPKKVTRSFIKHFCTEDHDLDDMKIGVVEVLSDGTGLSDRASHWIKLLRTQHPYGLNDIQ